MYIKFSLGSKLSQKKIGVIGYTDYEYATVDLT